MFQCWKASFKFVPSKSGRSNTVVINQEIINEVIAGAKQFTFNMSDSLLAKASVPFGLHFIIAIADRIPE